MVYVRLAQKWKDGAGASYAAGDMVDVDAGTLAQLEAQGIVTPPGEASVGADAGKGGPDEWAGPGSPDRD
jgi:hypothetical protein